MKELSKGNILNLIAENLNDNYYGFLVRKTKKVWLASLLEDIPKNLTCAERIINNENGEGLDNQHSQK